MNNGNVDWNNKNNNNYVRAVSEFQKIINTMITIESLYEAYWTCRKNKARTHSAMCFELDYENNLSLLYAEIVARTYQPGRSIAFIITKPIRREIFAADFRDRIIHHWICARIEPLLENEFVDESFNCRKDKGNLAGIDHIAKAVYECSEGYTGDCWIMKVDMQGFFMSISRQLLCDKLCRFVESNYSGDDIDDLLYLMRVIYLNAPEKNCIIKGHRSEWESLPANKSLFTTPEGYGLPIGNLTSQMAANYLLNDTDHFIRDTLQIKFARYVDDICLVDSDKYKLLTAVPAIRRHLHEMAGVTLHPNKFYLQHYTKGVSFIGGVIKRERRYISNRTVASAQKRIHKFNELAKIPGFTEKNAEKFAASVNSYLGMMIHFHAYDIRRKLIAMISPEWSKVLCSDKDFSKLVVKPKYKHNNRVKHIVKKQRKSNRLHEN